MPYTNPIGHAEKEASSWIKMSLGHVYFALTGKRALSNVKSGLQLGYFHIDRIAKYVMIVIGMVWNFLMISVELRETGL